MARGVADVLALYLDPPGESAGRESMGRAPRDTGPGVDAPAVETRALWVPCAGSGLVEAFVVWNLNRALTATGRELVLRPSGSRCADTGLLLLYASEIGLQRAERQLGELGPGQGMEVVVYGDRGWTESGTWVRRLAERIPSPLRLVHRGGVETGHSLARSILLLEAIVDRAPPCATRRHWITVAARIGQVPGAGDEIRP